MHEAISVCGNYEFLRLMRQCLRNVVKGKEQNSKTFAFLAK